MDQSLLRSVVWTKRVLEGAYIFDRDFTAIKTLRLSAAWKRQAADLTEINSV